MQIDIVPVKNSKQRTGMIQTLHGSIEFNAFLPDATYGTINSLSFPDLKKTNTNEFVTTTLHLEQLLGSTYVKKLGGLHKFLGWDRPILTDSGGFQVFSLIYRTDNKANKITEAGCSFINYRTGSYNFLTPEISQFIQHDLGSDIRLVLDIPIREDSTEKLAKESVERNTRWAKRAKAMFLKLNNLTEKDFNNPETKRPLLGAIIQGANSIELRKQSALELVDIGFDIYCFGGLPLTKAKTWLNQQTGDFNHQLITYVANLLPADKIRYGMGLGSPDDLIFASQAGWDIFDSVLPTRNARHGYLYVHSGEGDSTYKNYDVLHVKNSRYQTNLEQPIDSKCKCEACKHVSRAYLRYLLKIKNPTGHRLATIHNLTFYAEIMQNLRQQKYTAN